MAVIDAEGYFNGDRFDLVSDDARLVWPSLWCASNSVGRLELNYQGIISRAFRRFKKPPTYKQLFGWIKEYSEAFLLFVYQAPDGSLWGQWDTTAKWLPRYQTEADKQSPAPDYELLTRWRNRYTNFKKERNSSLISDFVNFPQIPLGVGVGVGVGVGEKPCAADRAANVPTRTQPQPDTGIREQQAVWFSEFWALYWRKVGKKPAWDSFKCRVTTPERWQKVRAAVQSQSQQMLARDPERRPHASTWLNQERWNDEVDMPASTSAHDPLARFREMDRQEGIA